MIQPNNKNKVVLTEEDFAKFWTFCVAIHDPKDGKIDIKRIRKEFESFILKNFKLVAFTFDKENKNYEKTCMANILWSALENYISHRISFEFAKQRLM